MTRLRQRARLWSYALAEASTSTQQKLHLPLPATKNTSDCTASSSVALDATTTSSLRDQCASRGVPLESVLLASLFLAAAEALQTEQIAASEGGQQERPFRIRVQRGLILAVVCVVMAILSGSLDSKALRYFCSFYAVFAGIWAVNAVTVELPGYTVLMATAAAVKAGEDAATATFTPAKLSIDCTRDLWGTADRHRLEARGMESCLSSFARFKTRMCCIRGLGWQRWQGVVEAPDAGKPSSAFQLFACIKLEGSVDGSIPAPTPEEALSSVRRPEATTTDSAGGVTESGDCAEHTPDKATAVAALLDVLDSKYTLLYRERKAEKGCVIAGAHESDEGGDSGDGGALGSWETVAAAPLGAGPALPDLLDLVVVEGKRALSGKGSSWLLERAKTALIEACSDGAISGGR